MENIHGLIFQVGFKHIGFGEHREGNCILFNSLLFQLAGYKGSQTLFPEHTSALGQLYQAYMIPNLYKPPFLPNPKESDKLNLVLL